MHTSLAIRERDSSRLRKFNRNSNVSRLVYKCPRAVVVDRSVQRNLKKPLPRTNITSNTTPISNLGINIPEMAPKTSDYLNIKSINECVVATEYAVRGEIVSIAQEMAKVIDAKGKDSGYPFEKIVWCNIGNPHILGQKPITYFRQVLALCEYPALLENPAISQIFPSDVIERANLILKNIPGGVGAYSESAGAFIVRKLVAEAVQRRDGVFCDPDNLFMTDGASPAVHYMMDLLLREDSNDGLMVPIPQYPLYSATLTLYGGHLVPYHLNESSGWSLDVDVLRKNLYAAREKGVCVRGLVVINPGNPTGQCLSDKNIVDIVHFCYDEGLVLIADEVYQTNIYVDDKDFNSFRSVAHREGLLEKLPVVSLHSISKGFVGECGRRGGYMEVTGFPNDVKEQIIKLASINLCPNLSGQICCALMMNPPKEGEPSYELYASERDAILGSLRRRAQVLVSGLRKLEGVTCNDAEGALYAFPCIKLPAQAVAEAKRIGKQPDWLYSREMLDATGIVVVPGSGFGQEDGTYHFRTTFLPSEGDIGSVVDLLSVFHAKFLTKYGGL